ncbi:MAG: hypothetical protein EAZ44_07805 [Cytophagia bacterium]|nr:MAG: hypothetical protein EAZ44_07805 [Cytophagia bacterium]TAG39552.1 MAG: hypothetical protein EAZ31_09080 [Cytophagia bacterium]
MKIILLNELESVYYYDQINYVLTKNEINENIRLRNFNNLYLGFINQLTEQREKQIFSGWFAKINFLVQAYNFSKEEGEILQSIRRLCRKALTQKKFIPEKELVIACAKVMANTIARFSEGNMPEKLEKLWKNETLPTLIYTEIPEAQIKGLLATITEKSPIEKLETQNLKQIHLQCDTENFGIIKITLTDVAFYNQKGENFRTNFLSTECHLYVKKYQTVYFTHLEKLEENHFVSTRNTSFVIHADYLIDVTKIALCGKEDFPAFPYFYILDKITSFNGSIHTFRGTLANEILDKYLADNTQNYDHYFKESLQEKQADALSSHVQAGEITTLYNNLQPHFSNMKKVMDNYDNFYILTEPTFVSSVYGLQGRLDILLTDIQHSQRKDIIELKSGTPKRIPANYDHLLQVAGYNLLLETTFPHRNGVSSILYSSDEKTPLRDCGSLEFDAQDLLRTRNQIVYLDWEISQGNVELYDKVVDKFKKSNKKISKYTQLDIENFVTKWKNASLLDKVYFASLMGLVQRELITAKIGGNLLSESASGFSGLWRNTLHEKKNNFAILYGLELEKYKADHSEITFLRPLDQKQATAFRKNDIVMLYPCKEIEELAPTQYQLLKANIQSITSTKITLKIWHKAMPEAFLEEFKYWAIEPTLLEQSYTAQMNALSDFLGLHHTKKQIWYGKTKPTFVIETKEFRQQLVENYKNLSEEQLDILSKTLRTQNYFLLQGPPGTGKTSQMLRTITDYLYNYTRETIVLLAFTNRATDEICQKIEKSCSGNYLRLGTFDNNAEFYNKSLLSENNFEKLIEKINNTRIFVSTVSSFFKYAHLVKNKDILIVDEASQLLEPMLCGIAPFFERFIMIGDEKQLPAVVTQSHLQCESDNDLMKNIGLEDMSLSVFERLLHNAQKNNWNDCYTMLSTQFRTHQDIAAFISKEFYKTLKAGSEKQKEKFNFYNPNSNIALEKKMASSRVLFFDIEKEETPKLNRKEAQQIAEMLYLISDIAKQKGTFTHETVGVITPYRAQIAEIYTLLDDELREMITIDTVERYQGSERDIILVSMAVNHPAQMKNLQGNNKEIDKKLNVVLSRAKEQIIMLGNATILKEGFWYDRFLKFVEEKNTK